MIETALRAFTTFFATIGPVEAAVLFATLTPKMPRRARAAIALRATIIASVILLVFTLLGQPLREFWRRYVELHGFREGWLGLVLSLVLAFYSGKAIWLARRATFQPATVAPPPA